MIKVNNEQFVDLYLYEPIDGAIRIDQGQGEITPDITVSVDAIPRLITSLATMLTPEQLTQLMNELGKIGDKQL